MLFLLVIFFVFSEFVYVPGGFLADKDCISNVPSGSHVVRKDDYYEVTLPDGSVIKEQKCDPSSLKPNPENSWQQWTTYEYKAGKQIDEFSGNMVVPELPSEHAWAEILYIFPGLQNVNWIPTLDGGSPMPSPFDIIQPVLQYNYNREGWMLANWYVGDDKVLTSKYVYDVKAGDVIYGYMKRTGSDTYEIYAIVNNDKTKETTMTVSSNRLNIQNWAYTTVEKYGGSSCDCFPQSNLTFSEMKMSVGGKPLSYDWKPTVRIPCMKALDVRSPELVVYDFKNTD